MSLDPITAGIDLVKLAVDKIWPDKSEAEKAALAGQITLASKQMDMDSAAITGQLAINQQEAASAHWFVSGWRPFIGWICGFGLLWAFVLGPLLTFIAGLAGSGVVFPALDIGTLMTLLFGMLGLGAQKSFEKAKGVETVRLTK